MRELILSSTTYWKYYQELVNTFRLTTVHFENQLNSTKPYYMTEVKIKPKSGNKSLKSMFWNNEDETCLPSQKLQIRRVYDTNSMNVFSNCTKTLYAKFKVHTGTRLKVSFYH